MYRIIDERGSGKTSRLMLIAKENDATFVCWNPNVLRDKAFEYGITDINFISYKEFLENREKIQKYVLDELELFLKYIAQNSTLIGYTLNIDK